MHPDSSQYITLTWAVVHIIQWKWWSMIKEHKIFCFKGMCTLLHVSSWLPLQIWWGSVKNPNLIWMQIIVSFSVCMLVPKFLLTSAFYTSFLGTKSGGKITAEETSKSPKYTQGQMHVPRTHVLVPKKLSWGIIDNTQIHNVPITQDVY